MGWISAEDYGRALPDPLAKAAPGIIRHMNSDHADALRLIAHRFAGEAPDEAAMTAVDRLASISGSGRVTEFMAGAWLSCEK
jgi:hypothetical protein